MKNEKISKRHEDLLEAIYEVSEQKGYAKSRDIAAALSITPATVTDGFKRLSDAGFVHYEPYGGVTLTDTGTLIAKRTQRSHQILDKLLRMAGVPPETADTDACIMEHGLSRDSFIALKGIVTFIEWCLEKDEIAKQFLQMTQPKITDNSNKNENGKRKK
jgi:DtxR family Mn-dependent transcriptional regulator